MVKRINEDELIDNLIKSVEALGWGLVFDSGEEDIHGMVIGTSDYLDKAAEALEKDKVRKRGSFKGVF